MAKRHIYLLFGFFALSLVANAQNKAIEQYNQFKQQAHLDYDDFRKKCNAIYANFLRESWESYKAGPIIPKPQDEVVPPVVMPGEDIDSPIEPKPIPIDSVVSPIFEEPAPQPKPISPIYENENSSVESFTFTFFGTESKVRLPREQSKTISRLNSQLSGDNLAAAWEELCKGDYDNLIRDCLELRIRHNLSDWAYLQMISELCEKYYGGHCNAATMLMSWIYCQTGYQLRSAIAGSKLYMLYGTQHLIYDLSYYVVDGVAFYPFLHKGEPMSDNIQICGASFPEEKPMSLYIPFAQTLSERLSSPRTIKSDRYPSAIATVQVNQNQLAFYNTYPPSMIGENFCTRWEMYANTPMAENIKMQLYPQLRKIIEGKSQLDAANILLNWVQTGFIYEYDDKVWGEDRAFFAEESLFYPYCDCEDRSILFTRLVRDLLGLKCILIYYPGHLACAVNFTESVNGDYINLNGVHFTITDPTYIGAPVGYTMPDMDNKTATVILLN